MLEKRTDIGHRARPAFRYGDGDTGLLEAAVDDAGAGRCATNGGSESRDSANASAAPVRSISTAASTEVAAVIVLFFKLRSAARIVVVLAMPTTRTLGRSTSARLLIPDAPVTI